MATARHPASTLLTTRDADRARTALHWVAGELIASIERELREALAGSDAATRAYVRAYRQLTACLLTAADAAQRTNGRVTGGAAVLDHTAASAPFTPWVARYEHGDGVALVALNTLRELLGVRSLQPPPVVAIAADDVAVQRFMRRVRHFLNHPEDQNPLERLMEAFDLSKSELGRLFGVSRQAIDGWLEKGVPSDRQEKLATVLAVTDLLERKLKPGRLPGVARRAADAYGGSTMLELIAADRQAELLANVRESFDWATAA
jgi:hypothetical protein